MRNEDFNKIVAGWVNKIRARLALKGVIYSSGEDRLIQFKNVANMLDVSPARVCFMFLMKHISKFILARGEMNSAEREEIYGDIISYLILLDAIQTEEEENARS